MAVLLETTARTRRRRKSSPIHGRLQEGCAFSRRGKNTDSGTGFAVLTIRPEFDEDHKPWGRKLQSEDSG